VKTFDDLSHAQLEVVRRLAERRGILASNYVRGVVPSTEYGDARELVLNIERFIADRFPPSAAAQLRMEPVYEREIGRPLSEEERHAVGSLQSLSPAHLAVATQLAVKDTAYAMAYLSEVVKSAGRYDREMFAEALRSRAKATE
jgi:hypothetical protein